MLEPSGSPIQDTPKDVAAYEGPIDLIGSPDEIARAIVAAVARIR